VNVVIRTFRQNPQKRAFVLLNVRFARHVPIRFCKANVPTAGANWFSGLVVQKASWANIRHRPSAFITRLDAGKPPDATLQFVPPWLSP
jgi:hypothetical protein